MIHLCSPEDFLVSDLQRDSGVAVIEILQNEINRPT